MRLSTSTTVVVCCHAAAAIGGSQAFVISERAVAAPRGRESASGTAKRERLAGGPLVELRGGKTVGSTKSGSETSSAKSKASAKGKGKGAKKSKSSKGSSKPSFMATIKAFFESLVNPHFALKLQAKQKDQIHTVHGSASTAAKGSA